MLLVIWLGVLLVTLWSYFRKIYSRFSEHGVKYFQPVPLLGNAGSVTLKKWHMAEDIQKLYEAFPEDRFIGRYEMTLPVVVIRDLELIKNITVRDFEHFLDHRSIVDESVDTLFGRALFSLKGEEWKDMRSTLSPAFTSAKMKNMVPFMVDVNQQMISVLKNKIQQSGDHHIEIECKDLTMRYANDVIASCAFGVKVDSHTDSQNQFYTVGQSTAQFGFKRILKLNQKLYDDETRDFFTGLVLNNMREREAHNVHRPDMIHLLMEAKRGNLTYDLKTQDTDAGFATVEESDFGKKLVNRTWSDDDLTAQAFVFFLAGFETVSTTMTFLLYELAVHPEIQERLVQEIRENHAKSGGKVDFSSVQSLKYMDMVVSEVLRLWPPAIAITRNCVKDYNLGKPHDKAKSDYIIHRNESVMIPVWAMHHDPKYFPNPEKFDPERFNEQNKHKIKPYTYLPFGTGPRNCIGSRFALCEVKVMLYQFLQQLEVSACSKTCIPAKLSPASFTLCIEGGHWIRLSARK